MCVSERPTSRDDIDDEFFPLGSEIVGGGADVDVGTEGQRAGGGQRLTQHIHFFVRRVPVVHSGRVCLGGAVQQAHFPLCHVHGLINTGEVRGI